MAEHDSWTLERIIAELSDLEGRALERYDFATAVRCVEDIAKLRGFLPSASIQVQQ